MRTVILSAAVVATCASISGCCNTPTRMNSTLSLDAALTDIRQSLIKFRPQNAQEELGVILTDIQVVLKIEESGAKTVAVGGEPVVKGLPGATVNFSSVNTDSMANTITLTFKDPNTVSSQSIAGLREAIPGKSVVPGTPWRPYGATLKSPPAEK